LVFKLAVDGIAIRRVSVSTAGGIAARHIPDAFWIADVTRLQNPVTSPLKEYAATIFFRY
jgi:hypothetical protein